VNKMSDENKSVTAEDRDVAKAFAHITPELIAKTKRVQKSQKQQLRDICKKRGRPSKLSTYLLQFPEEFEKILKLIEIGVYEHQAAARMGVTNNTWFRWKALGRETTDPIYNYFVCAVERASSVARGMAEQRVFVDDPKFWLLKGPGKSRANNPGWTDHSTIAGDVEQPMVHEVRGEIAVNHSNTESESGIEDKTQGIQGLAETLKTFADLGLIDITPQGATMFETDKIESSGDESVVLEATVNLPSPSENGAVHNPPNNSNGSLNGESDEQNDEHQQDFDY
jgi:hypothetical protein